MKIEEGAAHTAYRYWTVRVDANEVVTESGKTVPYSTWIGTIDQHGKITVWTPAAYVPRGYKAAAVKLLRSARGQLRRSGEVQ
jgi:hypothetical protein